MSIARVALWVVTLAALALCVRAAWFEVVPGVLLVGSLALVVGVVGLGIAYPGWEMFGAVLHTLPETSALVVLCVECPSDAPWQELLERLEQHNVHATFALRGLETSDVALARAVVQRGHDVLIGVNRSLLAWALVSERGVARQLAAAQSTLEQAVGVRCVGVHVPNHWGPPGLLLGTVRSGLLPVLARPRKPLRSVRPGQIVGLTIELTPLEARHNFVAIEQLVAEVRAAGFEVVTLSEALQRPAG